MSRSRSSWVAVALLLALCGSSRLFAVQQQGGGATGRGSKSEPKSTVPKPPAETPATPEPGGPPGSTRPPPATPKAETEERDVPDASSSPWRWWLARNFHLYEAAPITAANAPPGVPAHLLDVEARARKRELYVADVRRVLVDLTHDGSDRVRGAAAIALGRSALVDDASACDAILALLADSPRRAHDQALLALALTDGTAARYHLLRLVSESDGGDADRVRSRSLAAIFASLRGEPSLPSLVRDLVFDRHLATQHRVLVVQALGLSHSEAAVPWLVDLVRDRAEPSLVRAAAVTALGEVADPATATLVVSLLEERDRDTDVRAAAALAVGSLVRASDVDLIRALVKARQREGNAPVARFLLLSLGRVGGRLADLEIQRVLDHDGADDRAFAALATGLRARTSGGPQVLAPLFDLLRTTRLVDERCAILCALGLSGQAQAFEALSHEAQHGNSPDARLAAVVGLQLLGAPAGVDVLQKLLGGDDHPEIRIQAARALARLDPVATSSLVRAISSSRSHSTVERAALVLALGFTRDPSAIEPLVDLLREPGRPAQEREAATTALGLLFDVHRAPPLAVIGEQKNFLRESPEIPELLALTE